MRTLLPLLLAASTAAAQTEAPLRARILPPDHGLLAINVSDKAYVAIFSIPGDSDDIADATDQLAHLITAPASTVATDSYIWRQ